MAGYFGYQPPMPVASADQGIGLVYDANGESRDINLRLSRMPAQPSPENGCQTSISLFEYFGSLSRARIPYEQAHEMLQQAKRYAGWHGGIRDLGADGSYTQIVAPSQPGDALPPTGYAQAPPPAQGGFGGAPNYSLGQPLAAAPHNYGQAPSYGASAPSTDGFGGGGSRPEHRSESLTRQTHNHTIDASAFFGGNGSGGGRSRPEHRSESPTGSGGADLSGLGSMLGGMFGLGGSGGRGGDAGNGGSRGRRGGRRERPASPSPSPPPPSRRYTGAGRAPPPSSDGITRTVAGNIHGFNRIHAGMGEFRNPRSGADGSGGATRNVARNVHGFNRIHGDQDDGSDGEMENLRRPLPPSSSSRPRDEPRARPATSGGRTLGTMNARRGEGYSTRPASPPTEPAPSSGGRQSSRPQSSSAATSRQGGQRGRRLPNLNLEANAPASGAVSGNPLQMLLNMGMSREAAVARLATAQRNNEDNRDVNADVGRSRGRDNPPVEDTRDSNADGPDVGRRWWRNPRN
ncbi:hypothetical protein B0J14DRAFT_560906 [Halenospora varia]|nr:hypothetical protein B0J14DRAFT_560906 [Halenospora varia]